MLKRTTTALMMIACLALTACGGATSNNGTDEPKQKQDPATRFKVAATKAQGWETLRFSMSMNSASLGVISGEGEQDMAQQKLRMTMTMPAPGTPTGTMTMEQIMAGTNMYMKSLVFDELLEGGKTWVKFDLAQMGDALGIDVAAMFDQTQIDPQGPVSFLGGTDGDIEELGTELVRNTPTTHYRFTVDLAASAAALPPDLAEAVKPLFAEMPATFPAEAWMDEDNMVRRIRYTMALPGEEGQPAGAIDTQMEFFDFGAKVEIVEPGAAEVVDLGQMLQEAG